MSLDREYLSRPKLDVVFDYSQDSINVSSEHTCYIRYTKLNKLNQKDILDLYSSVVKLCREMKIKIHYNNKYKKFVTENWQSYMLAYKVYDDKFRTLISMIPKLQERGIHQGSADDAYLKKVTECGYQLSPFYYRNSVLSEMSHIYNELQKLEKHLKVEKGCADPMNSYMGKTVSVNL